MTSIRIFSLALSLALAACAPVPQRAGIPTEWQASPNFNERKPNFVILHHTSDETVDQALRTLADPLRSASAHYLVGRDGRIIQLVDERARAWHAGESKWGSDTDINSASIGVELDNSGSEPFPDVQISALLRLLADIRERYHVPVANFLGHADVAPRRKTDPSRFFPWKMLADHGFGLWCDPPFAEAPLAFDATAALRALGYDTGDAGAAIRAFNLHFLPDELSSALTERSRGLLYCLYRKADR
ncbi:MAG: N-acetylmuramoyl-L-alanine amidase [Betaproteobacteria bacterium]|nr:MAG: N-acetylmuramoyl-L-alanine amidase [Betaproteobacteria bacterium]